MKTLALTAGGVLLLLLASAAPAQPMRSAHSRHHATQSASTTDRQCASETEMQQMIGMMQQMMQMHQQMMSEGMKMPMNGGMKTPVQPANPGQNPPQPDPHQH